MAVFDRIPFALHVARVITLVLAIIGVSLFLILFVLATIGLNASTLFGDFVLGHGGHMFMWASAIFVFDGLFTERMLVVYAIMYTATAIGDLATCIVRAIEVFWCGSGLVCSSADYAGSQVATWTGVILLMISVGQVVVALLLKIYTHKYMSAIKVIILRGMRMSSSSPETLLQEDKMLTLFLKEMGIGLSRRKKDDKQGTSSTHETMVNIDAEQTAEFFDSDKDE